MMAQTKKNFGGRYAQNIKIRFNRFFVGACNFVACDHSLFRDSYALRYRKGADTDGC
jgi:hypothetical protein